MRKYIRYCLFTVSFAFFSFGLLYTYNNCALIGILLLFASNLLYAFEKFKDRIFFLTFHLMIFVFLLSRPTISFCKGQVWWYFTADTVVFMLIALFLTLLFLQLGAILTEQFLHDRAAARPEQPPKAGYFQSEDFLRSLQLVALFLFYITMVFFFAVEFEKLLFMRGKNYEEYYVSFTSSLPYAVRAAASMMKFAFCIFLATRPSKKLTFVPAVLYILSAIPSLIIGVRNPIVLNVLFLLLYYFIRDTVEHTEYWIGKLEKAVIVVTFPLALLFLSAYNYIRAGKAVATTGVFSSIVDLFYKQGVSFDVLGIGYDSVPLLPKAVHDYAHKNYTFGLFIDYFTHNSIAQKFFGAIDLGDGNSVIKATYGNSFAHAMSYVSRSDYLQGHGWGTSYILETYADYGYAGIILFSLVLGGFLIVLMRLLARRGWFGRSVLLIVLTSLFFTPRAEAVSSFSFLIEMPYWFTVIVCFVGAALCAKQYSFESYRKKRRNCRLPT